MNTLINESQYRGLLKNYKINDKVYVISTRGGRVSFHSQQMRALQLASLLSLEFEESREAKILVVGGGVAGATCFAALNSHGFTNVEGCEAQDSILQTQMSSAHRHAHPSYNDWPMLLKNRRFLSTTNLPFMNWYAENTANIVKMMLKDPLLERYRENFRTGVIVKDIEVHDGDIWVTSQVVGENEKSDPYDLVVCAVGFGIEKNLDHSASGSYWWTDHIKHYRSEHQNYDAHTFYVTGTGDGGLIDYVRLGMKVGNVRDEDEPNLALPIISQLRQREYRELDDNWPDDSELMSEYERKISDCFTDINTSKPELKLFATKFRRIVREMRSNSGSNSTSALSGVFAKVRSNFRPSTHLDRIVLVGENNQLSPYRPNVSPINALLCGLVIEEKPHIRYRQGNGKPGPLKLKFKNLRASYRVPETPNVHFARIGSKDITETLFSACETLSDGYAKWIEEGETNNFIIRDRSNNIGEGTVEFGAELRRELAQQFADRYFDEAEVDLLKPTGDEEEHFLEFRVPKNKKNTEAHLELGGFDREIFGLKTKYATDVRIGEIAPEFVEGMG